MAHRYDVPAGDAVAIPADSDALARGEHIVRTILACADCHGADLGGRVVADAGPVGLFAAPNITRGKGGRMVALSDADVVRAIRHGVRGDGTSLLMMPSEGYAHMTDADLGAVVAYVRHVPPVDRDPPSIRLRPFGRVLLGAGKLALLSAKRAQGEHPDAPVEPAATAEYGGYLVNIAGCRGCHAATFGGGKIADGPPNAPPAPDITPGGEVGKWTEADFVRALREGKRPNGIPMNELMPWKIYGHMTDQELAAIWEYLKTVPPAGAAPD